MPPGARVRTPHGLIDISPQSRELLLELLAQEGCTKDVAAFNVTDSESPVELDDIGRARIASVIISTATLRVIPTDLIALKQALKD
jgi:hypothetical protein